MPRRLQHVDLIENPVDDDRVSEFMRTQYRSLLSTLVLVCGDARVAEEAIQEALLRSWSKAKAGEQIESLGAWVRVVALNLTRDCVRRLLRERRALLRLANEMDRSTTHDDFIEPTDVVRALARLSRRQREVTVLHYRVGLSIKEIASALGMAEGTVKVQLHRARAALAKQLDPAIESVPVVKRRNAR